MSKGSKEVVKVLEYVKEDGITQAQLVKVTGLSKSTVSYILKSMEERGIVRRAKKGKDLLVWLQRYAPSKPTKLIKIGFIRAIEYSYLLPFSELLREIGYSLSLKVYENGLSVMNNLLTGKLDMALAPLITQMLLASSTKGGIRLVAAAGRGGSSLISTHDRLERMGSVGTTPLSTMELNLLSTVVSEGLSPEALEVTHARSGQGLVDLIVSNQVEALSIWEPYPTVLAKMGYKRLVRYSEFFGDFVCCTLSCRGSCSEDVLQAYIRSFDLFTKRKSEYAKMFSRRIGLPVEVAETAIRDLEFRPELEKAEIKGILYRSGLWGLIPLVEEVVI